MNMITRIAPVAPTKLFIGGQWVEPISRQTLDVISPVTEERILSYPEAGRADIDRAVAEARDAFDNGPWPRMAAVRARALSAQGRRVAVAAARRHRQCLDAAGRRADHADQEAGRTESDAVQLLCRPDRDLSVRRRPQARRRRQGEGGARSRSASAPRSRRGTRRWCCSATRSRRVLPPAARSCPSRRRRRRWRPTSWPNASRRPGCRRACSISCRPAARAATISCATRASTRSPSPARPRPASISPLSARNVSPASASSSAASRPRSCSTMPTSRPRCRA